MKCHSFHTSQNCLGLLCVTGFRFAGPLSSASWPPLYLYAPSLQMAGQLFSKSIVRWGVFTKAERLRPQLAREVITFWDSLSLSRAKEEGYNSAERGRCAFLWILKFSDFPRHTHYRRHYHPLPGISGIIKEERKVYAELLKEHYLSLAFSRLPAKWSQQKFKFLISVPQDHDKNLWKG